MTHVIVLKELRNFLIALVLIGIKILDQLLNYIIWLENTVNVLLHF